MAASVFVCYAHADQTENKWLERLSRYLAQGRTGSVDFWHDGRIPPGSDWRDEIEAALRQASAAIVLAGPGLMGSDFVQKHELPALLEAARSRGLHLFPLVVGYCNWEGSALAPRQAFNDVSVPLESLPVPEQNRILNALSIAVSKAVERRQVPAATGTRPEPAGQPAALRRLLGDIELTRTAFEKQNRHCGALMARVKERLRITADLQYEGFLFRYHDQMTPEELFEFQKIRAVTDGPLAQGNGRILELLLAHPELQDGIPALTALRQHLVFWMNKYEQVFRSTPAMAVCYVAEEDGVPWPGDVERAVRQRLARLSEDPAPLTSGS